MYVLPNNMSRYVTSKIGKTDLRKQLYFVKRTALIPSFNASISFVALLFLLHSYRVSGLYYCLTVEV